MAASNGERLELYKPCPLNKNGLCMGATMCPEGVRTMQFCYNPSLLTHMGITAPSALSDREIYPLNGTLKGPHEEIVRQMQKGYYGRNPAMMPPEKP